MHDTQGSAFAIQFSCELVVRHNVFARASDALIGEGRIENHIAANLSHNLLLGPAVALYPGSYRGAIRNALETDANVIGIGVDTTGSSSIPANSTNSAIACNPEWTDHPAAQCWLWKDHTSASEAAEITELAAKIRLQYIVKCGKVYTSEWSWTKILHCLRTSPSVFNAPYSWFELADWIPSLLAGVHDPLAIKSGVCMAVHKALYAAEWCGLPDMDFLATLDPALANLRDRLYPKAHDATISAGNLCDEWSKKLGLPAGIPLAIGEMDVHYGAIGCCVDEGTLV